MDDSWRFRSIHGDICPTCSTPHFPFCPPPPSLPLPSFNPHHAVEALRRFPPPTFNSHPAPLPPPQSFPPPPAAPLPELWTADLPSRHRFPHEELLERENYRKRVRVDEPPSLSHFPPPQPFPRFDPPSTWISSEDERRLSLIRSSEDERRLSLIRNHGPSGAAQRYGDCNFQAPALGPASTNSQLLPQHEVGYHTQPPQANQYDGYRDFAMGPGLHSVEKIAHQESTDLGRGQFDKPDWFAPQERRGIWRGEFDTVERFATQERKDFQRQGFNGTERFFPQERMYIQRGEFSAMDRPAPQDGRDGSRGEFDTAERFMSHERTGAQIGEFHNSERFTLQERRGFQREEPGTGDQFVPQETRDFRRGDFDSGRGGVSDGQIKDQLYGRYCQHESLQQLPKSYSHGQSFERPMSYDDQPSEEWPFCNPTPQASCPADYAPRDPYKNYYTQDHQVVQLNESSSSVVPRPAQYAQLDGNMLPSNVMNCEQQSSYPSHATEYPRESKLGTHGQHANSMGTSSEYMPPFREDIHKPFDPQAYPIAQQPCDLSSSRVRSYLPASQPIDPPIYPPLPPQPTAQIYPPLPPEPLVEEYPKPPAPDPQNAPSLPEVPPMLVPAPPSTSTTMPPPPPPNAHGFSEPSFSEPHPSPEANFYKRSNAHASTPFTSEMQGLPLKHQAPSIKIPDEEEPLLPFKYPIEDKSTVIDACHLFKKPYRALRPDRVVIILRGLPGSGKSYLAKALRDIEVENGGGAPRIHAMDDYFMIEVEKKLEDSDGTKSSTSVRGKKTKKVIEYCYEPEMEEAYRSSMLKAFKKTLDEGVFTFVIVDDRNLRVADFAQFWAIAKRSGYEVYLLEAKYKDPAGCAARNVHGFNLDDIQKMSEQWEEASSLYLQLDIQSLFHGDDLNEHSIKEVDMDTDDPACDDGDLRRSQDGDRLQFSDSVSINYELDDGVVKIGDRWDTEEAEEPNQVKELKRSKWSKDFDDADNKAANEKPNSNALSGLIQAYGKSEKSVHWGDQVDKSGFSIGAVKKKNVSSIIIGPGSGYNLISNPLVEDDMEASGRGNINESKSRFSEQLRAESESFKEVFDRRRQRIGGMFSTEDE